MKTKICTDIKQSQKLIKLGLDPKTADMFWRDWRRETELITIPCVGWGNEKEDLPAWSLSTLINMMPEVIKREDKRKVTMAYTPSYSRVISPHRVYYSGDDGYAMDYIVANYNNGENDLVDACCNMLGWLIRHGYIKIEKK